MARKCLIQRQIKRKCLYNRYVKKRYLFLSHIKTCCSLNEKIYWHFKLQNLPRDSSLTRLHNRCLISGRPKGIFKFFGLSRHFIREYAHKGYLPGVIKASW